MKNQRLQAIADCIPAGSIVADIGTDHAYLPCELITSGKAVKCYACDIAEGPLKSAQATIKQEKLESQITTLLCPGLKDVPADANVAVIAGMGWITAKSILEDDFLKLEQFDLFLIQVNRDVPYLRQWLIEHNFGITIEKVIQDRMFYTILGFEPKKRQFTFLNRAQLLFGPLLMEQRSDSVRAYYHFLLEKNKSILSRLHPASEKGKDLFWQIEVLEQLLSQ